ncbi:MAG TPA: protein kinase [Kofleriaceae bacterium]|nr:protein kinase [Kofleriaceae bacterium]
MGAPGGGLEARTVASIGPGVEVTLPAATAGAAAARPAQRYVIRRELARGGMGKISVADDLLLRRTVALKELLVDNAGLAARFQRELDLTARLQHPSIVCIHDGGVWPNGNPFYVMKLVIGEPLDRVMARATTHAERFALLPRVLDVADAIAYAHEQGVIHRDLKPSNILAGRFGETVVIDWGIAKDLLAAELEPDAAASDRVYGATLDGSVMGTPAYMPPEQALGEAVDERADVYAIGAVLYQVLAGAPPYAGTGDVELLAAVVSQPPAPLAARAPGLPPELVAIVDKAMARDLDHRYRTASELAADLRRFLGGQLVGAHSYSTRQLLARWLKRHKTAAIVAAIAMLVVAAVSAVSVARIVDAQHVASDQRELAIRQRDKAEDLVSFMLDDLRPRLERVGKLDVLDDVTNKARGYFDQADGIDTVKNVVRQADIHIEVGDVQLAQGHPNAAIPEACAALSLAWWSSIVDPGGTDWRPDVTAGRVQLARAMQIAGRNLAALDEFRAALAAARDVVRVNPTPDAQRDANQIRRAVAELLVHAGRYDEAIAEVRAAIAASERLAADHPSAMTRRDVAAGQSYLGTMLANHGDGRGALVAFRASLAILDQLAASDPGDMNAQTDLQVVHGDIAETLGDVGDRSAGLADARAALAIATKLAEREPNNQLWQSRLAAAHELVGIAIGDHDPKRACAELRAALAICEALVASHPDNADALRGLSVSQDRLARGLLEADDLRGALGVYRDELVIRQRLAARDPNDASLQELEAETYLNLANVQAGLHDVRGASRSYRSALALIEPLVARDPSNGDLQLELATAREGVGDELAAEGDHSGAHALFAAALPVFTAHAHDADTRDVVVELRGKLRATQR